MLMINPEHYTGRELSWLQFNGRVLEEAIDPNNPLLEQLKFLAIFSSNLDEYFMIRVSGMKGQIDIKLSTPDRKTGYMATDYLQKMVKDSKVLVKEQYRIYKEKVEELNEYISFGKYQELSDKNKARANRYFDQLLYPVLTPIRFSPYLPFPLLPNLSLYLITKLQDQNQNSFYSVVTIPRNIERFVKIHKDKYVLSEDIVINNISKVYEGLEVLEIVPFRITRDFDIEFDGQSDDFAKSVTNELRNRKRGDAIRLEISSEASEEIVEFLVKNLNIQKKLIFKIDGPIDLTFFHEVYEEIKPKISGLVFLEKPPIESIQFKNEESIIDVMRKKDVMLFHPHQSYEPVIRLIEEASLDPKVVAIKQTIYRTSKDSRIMKYLVNAADKGIQVTVLFELKARFDEENNLYWGNELVKSGAHVIYGVPHLKTHSKVLLIVRRDKNNVERFVHLSTGNYNEENAKIYTDISYFTAKKTIGEDATKFFNYISSYNKKPDYKKLVASPNSIRERVIQKIDQEIENQKQYGNGYIIIKVNSITDIETIEKLYEASRNGVKIDMIVRGICSVKPGIKDVSDNIRVISIVGRYLEHMRIFYFYNNGIEDIFVSSADLMTRNLESRIELALKITDRVAKTKMKKLLNLQLKDNQKARENILGKYYYVLNDLPKIDSQMDFYKYLK